jgi:hypothetical protein
MRGSIATGKLSELAMKQIWCAWAWSGRAAVRRIWCCYFGGPEAAIWASWGWPQMLSTVV